LVESELILRQFRAADIRVVEVEGGNDLTAEDTDNPTQSLVRQVLGSVAQFEKGALVAKLRQARERIRRQRGKCEGRKPYGWHQAEKEVLAGIRRLRRHSKKSDKKPMTWTSIAAALNSMGLRNRSGGLWTAASVQWVARRRPLKQEAAK
jgi:site-specific DNA recombinase